MSSFGRDGRFMQDALKSFDHHDLIQFFKEIGVDTHAPDGFRVFPTSHSSATIISALQNELDKLGVNVLCLQKVEELLYEDSKIKGVKSSQNIYNAVNVIVATGGLGYPTLGAEGDGHKMASDL